MDDPAVRYHRFKDENIFSLLKEKEQLITEFKEMQAKIDAIVTGSKPKGNQLQLVKDKLHPLLKEAMKDVKLGEWELFIDSSTEADECKCTIIDELEEAKKRILERKQQENENIVGDTNSGAAPLEASA